MTEPLIVRIVVILSVAVYFIFERLDRRHPRDEREEFIRLKTHELVHNATVITLSAVALWYCVNPRLNAVYPILLTVCASLYTEIFGKIWFRKKY